MVPSLRSILLHNHESEPFIFLTLQAYWKACMPWTSKWPMALWHSSMRSFLISSWILNNLYFCWSWSIFICCLCFTWALNSSFYLLTKSRRAERSSDSFCFCLWTFKRLSRILDGRPDSEFLCSLIWDSFEESLSSSESRAMAWVIKPHWPSP